MGRNFDGLLKLEMEALPGIKSYEPILLNMILEELELDSNIEEPMEGSILKREYSEKTIKRGGRITKPVAKSDATRTLN